MARKVSLKRKKELRKKIPQIQAGLGTVPPDEWFKGMSKITKQGYPGRNKQQLDRITSGIWHSYSPQAKIGIIRRLSAGTGGIPREQNPGTCNVCGRPIDKCYCEECEGIEQNPYEHSKAWETASPPDYTRYPEEEDPDYISKTKGLLRSGSHLLVEQNPLWADKRIQCPRCKAMGMGYFNQVRGREGIYQCSRCDGIVTIHELSSAPDIPDPKCPNCGGLGRLMNNAGKHKCRNCGYEFFISGYWEQNPDFCPGCGGDTIVCQGCGKIRCSVCYPHTYTKRGNLCNQCYVKLGRPSETENNPRCQYTLQTFARGAQSGQVSKTKDIRCVLPKGHDGYHRFRKVEWGLGPDGSLDVSRPEQNPEEEEEWGKYDYCSECGFGFCDDLDTNEGICCHCGERTEYREMCEGCSEKESNEMMWGSFRYGKRVSWGALGPPYKQNPEFDPFPFSADNVKLWERTTGYSMSSPGGAQRFVKWVNARHY